MAVKAIQNGKKISLSRNYRIVPDILDNLAENHKTKGVTYITPSGEEAFFSYEAMRKRALRCLAGLQARGIKAGDILAVETEEPELFHVMFWACMYGGIIVTSISQPASFEAGAEGLSVFLNQLAKLDMPVIATQRSHIQHYSKIKQSVLQLSFLVIEDLEAEDVGVCAAQGEEDVVFIQFSSGTTGTPEGAMLTHKNIIISCIATAEAIQLRESDAVFSWLPHTHNLGLFTPVIIAMIMKNDEYFIKPAVFMKNPLFFLQKIAEHKGGWFCINNFGLEWMIHQIPDQCLEGMDLSSLKSIFAGAENISSDTITRFVEKFSKCGITRKIIRPGYGMTEATLVISLTGKADGPIVQNISRNSLMQCSRAVQCEYGESQDGVSYTGNGVPVNELDIRIVDEDGKLEDEGCIGEIQARGASIFQGYYNEPDKLAEMVKDGWLCTGDLGYISEGQLFIVGRKKDVVIIRGVNYIVTDMEEVVCRVAGLLKGTVAVTSVIEKQQEELAVFVKYQEDMESFVDIRKMIIRGVNEAFRLNLQKVIPIVEVPKTNSGKTKRYLLKMQYESGIYDEICEKIRKVSNIAGIDRTIVKAETKTEKIIEELWKDILQPEDEDISVHDTFASLGGGSVQAYQLIERLSGILNVEIGHEILTRCKTIAEMADFLDTRNNEFEKENTESDNNDGNEKLAVTGIGFRLPEAQDQEMFWKNLCEGKDCIRRVSEKRRNLAGDPEWADWMGELSDIDSFDYEFFDIDYDEAVFMEPQQRMAIEVTYEALADAGILTDEEEKKVAVFAAVCSNTYYPLVIDYVKENGYENISSKAMIGNMNNMIAARISHQYNFTGPVMAVDTACSSFMTALHMGRNAIIHGEAEGAVIIGANIIATPYTFGFAKKAGILSSTNESKVFDADADGSILGEGIIVLYLEKLSTAREKNKNIYGVIHQTSINNDGFALSMMSPNPKGEFQVLKEAYEKTDISPDDISYFEAHGTGTVIGDPIEINALSRLFKKHGKQEIVGKIAIGSVKTNIGHLLPAAGGAGILKVLMCLKYGKLVPSLHMEHINPLLELEKTPFRVVLDNEEWIPRGRKGRIAGISSLGLGGTNAHVILGEYTDHQFSNKKKDHILTVSAKSEEALNQIIQDTLMLVARPGVKMNDLCMTRNRYRKHYAHRAALVIDHNGKIISAVKKGKTIKAIPIKINIFISDICQNGTVEELHHIYNKFVIYKEVIHKLGRFYGAYSGKLIADLLEGRISMHDAEQIFTEHKSSGYTTLDTGMENTDVVLEIGEDKNTPLTKEHSIQKVSGILLDENTDILYNLQQLYVLGADINWELLYPDGSAKIMNLPAYPFVKNSIWLQ